MCSLADAPIWAWTDCAGLSGLHAELGAQRPNLVRISDIPRTGVIADVTMERELAEGAPLAEALACAEAVESASADTATPEQLHHLGEETGYRVVVTWGARPGTLDAVFIARNEGGQPAAFTDVYLPVTGAQDLRTALRG